ncbi:hypothetical protein EK904_009083 [Melospiza melodia maxima]|nr:hypothetical protein EK904_009083 [Melospiza melodia maxima]
MLYILTSWNITTSSAMTTLFTDVRTNSSARSVMRVQLCPNDFTALAVLSKANAPDDLVVDEVGADGILAGAVPGREDLLAEVEAPGRVALVRAALLHQLLALRDGVQHVLPAPAQRPHLPHRDTAFTASLPEGQFTHSSCLLTARKTPKGLCQSQDPGMMGPVKPGLWKEQVQHEQQGARYQDVVLVFVVEQRVPQLPPDPLQLCVASEHAPGMGLYDACSSVLPCQALAQQEPAAPRLERHDPRARGLVALGQLPAPENLGPSNLPAFILAQHCLGDADAALSSIILQLMCKSIMMLGLGCETQQRPWQKKSVSLKELLEAVADGVPGLPDLDGLHHPRVAQLLDAQLPVKQLQGKQAGRRLSTEKRNTLYSSSPWVQPRCLPVRSQVFWTAESHTGMKTEEERTGSENNARRIDRSGESANSILPFTQTPVSSIMTEHTIKHRAWCSRAVHKSP